MLNWDPCVHYLESECKSLAHSCFIWNSGDGSGITRHRMCNRRERMVEDERISDEQDKEECLTGQNAAILLCVKRADYDVDYANPKY